MMSYRYATTAIAAVFTFIMGLLYLVAYHIEGQVDEIFKQGVFVGITLVSGSMAVERLAKNNGHSTEKKD